MMSPYSNTRGLNSLVRFCDGYVSGLEINNEDGSLIGGHSSGRVPCPFFVLSLALLGRDCEEGQSSTVCDAILMDFRIKPFGCVCL